MRTAVLCALAAIAVPSPARAQSVPLAPNSATPGQLATRQTWTLDEVIRAATEQHPLIEAAAARLGAAQGTRQTAGTLPNPIATYWTEQGAAGSGGPGASSFTRETQAYF